MGSRARLPMRTLTSGGAAIILEKVLPFNATLLQLTAHFDAVPVLAGDFIAEKISNVAADYDVVFGRLDPSQFSMEDLICDDKVEFLKDDTVRITYTNPNNVTIGLELIFKEAD